MGSFVEQDLILVTKFLTGSDGDAAANLTFKMQGRMISVQLVTILPVIDQQIF